MGNSSTSIYVNLKAIREAMEIEKKKSISTALWEAFDLFSIRDL